jgi:hypothetical protein
MKLGIKTLSTRTQRRYHLWSSVLDTSTRTLSSSLTAAAPVVACQTTSDHPNTSEDDEEEERFGCATAAGLQRELRVFIGSSSQSLSLPLDPSDGEEEEEEDT